jgi:hypothetical protein
MAVFSAKSHDGIINCIDGAGGVGVKSGPPEIATGSRDGNLNFLTEILSCNYVIDNVISLGND